MIKLQDKPNVNPPDADYPYGSIRDRDGLIPGTPGNEEVYQDIHQFFEKLIRESNITPNNLPDGEYNGWQLWESLLEHIGGQSIKFKAAITQSGTNAPTFFKSVNSTGLADPIASYVGVGVYNFQFTGIIFPSANTFFAYNTAGNNGESIRVYRQSSSSFRISTFDATGTLANGVLSQLGIFVESFPV